MTLSNVLRCAGLSTLLFACAGIAAAQGPVANASTTTSELEMSAEVETALQLNISTGTGGAVVSGSNATGLFSIGFGNVNGLGVGTPAAGVTVTTDSTGALYKTPINLTPVYSGFNGELADVSVIADSSGNSDLAREGNSGISSSSTVGTSHSAFTAAASGSNNERYVGFYVPRTEVAGSKTATLIYTVTMVIN